jgi:urease accessory protein UreH
MLSTRTDIDIVNVYVVTDERTGDVVAECRDEVTGHPRFVTMFQADQIACSYTRATRRATKIITADRAYERLMLAMSRHEIKAQRRRIFGR